MYIVNTEFHHLSTQRRKFQTPSLLTLNLQLFIAKNPNPETKTLNPKPEALST